MRITSSVVVVFLVPHNFSLALIHMISYDSEFLLLLMLVQHGVLFFMNSSLTVAPPIYPGLSDDEVLKKLQ